MENQLLIYVGIGIAVIFMTMVALARLYRKAGPHEALIVYGGGKNPRVVKGGGTVIFPLLESCRGLSLELCLSTSPPSRTSTPGRA